MLEDQEKYERNFFYRLVKIAYILSFIFSCLAIIAIGWSNRPKNYVDYQKSYLKCDNGKSYTLASAKIFLLFDEKTLERHNDKNAKKACAYAITDDYLDEYQTPTDKNYTLYLSYYTQGSWWSVLLVWFVGIIGSYIILNLARETLNYIFFGRKLRWGWLKKLFELLKS